MGQNCKNIIIKKNIKHMKRTNQNRETKLDKKIKWNKMHMDEIEKKLNLKKHRKQKKHNNLKKEG
jgi:hypothetical protein